MRTAARLRIMTWNIHSARGSDGRCDLGRVSAIVKKHAPDILAVQEVDSRRSRGVEKAFEILSDAVGEHRAEARLILAADGDFGHALISRWCFGRFRKHDISVDGREPRAAIEADVETPFGPLHVVAAHLGLTLRERRHQANVLASLAEQGSACSVVIGDFNDWVWRGSVQRLLAKHLPNRTPHKTFPAWLPVLALDRIYFRPPGLLLRSWTDVSARCASDHLPVIADLDIEHLGEQYTKRE